MRRKEKNRIKELRVAVQELIDTSIGGESSTRWIIPILEELDAELEEIMCCLIGCEYALKLVKEGSLQLYGALQDNGYLLDLAVAKAATLLNLLPEEIQEKLGR